MSETSLRPLLTDKSPEGWDFPDVPAYRAEQIRQWVYDKGVLDFDAMSNLPADLRTRLTKEWEIRPMEQARVQGSAERIEGSCLSSHGPRLAGGQCLTSVCLLARR